MRGVLFLSVVLCLLSSPSAQNPENADSLTFKCTVLYPETSGYPEVSVKADTVKFTLYYVDNVCSGFAYRLSKKDNTLLLQRTTTPPDSCIGDEQMLYGVEGYIANVPKGKYLFDLQTGATDGKLESIFREVVVVKTKKTVQTTGKP